MHFGYKHQIWHDGRTLHIYQIQIWTQAELSFLWLKSKMAAMDTDITHILPLPDNVITETQNEST